MKYLKHYILLIRNAIKRQSINGYFEKHHVFPVSIYGNNSFTVKLTAKEHYVAHHLLWRLCKQRYGVDNIKTKKMHFAFNQMTWCATNQKRYLASSFASARMCASVYNSGENNPAKLQSVREKISTSKKGLKRSDLIGKKYFGASTEAIEAGIEKMRKSKLGKKISNYPKNRKGVPCSKDKAEKIRQSRLKTREKYIKMSKEQFLKWLHSKNPMRKDGGKNPNITNALLARGEKWEEYYDV
jgi:hypothetical protein